MAVNVLNLLAATLCYSLLASATISERQTSCTLSASGSDDAPALLNAVKACSVVTIPKTVNLNISSRLDMSNLSGKSIVLNGNMTFNPNLPYWGGHAFAIPYQNQYAFWNLGGQDITLSGGGTLNGKGSTYWSAFSSNSSLVRPIILHIVNAKNVLVENIKMIDSPEWFNLVESSTNVTYSGITITASTSSPNTDGWDTYRSSAVTIQNSVVVNGDDCVSFKPNSTNIVVKNLSCTSSHGISVGSLGQYSGVYDLVQDVYASNITMINCSNGARIKAWAGPGVGSGLVKNITFTGFTMSKTKNPLIIDQCYMTSDSDCDSNPSNTLIQDIYFNSFSGTAGSSTVADLECSPGSRCSNINVNGLVTKPSSGTAKYTCINTSINGSSASLFKCTTS